MRHGRMALYAILDIILLIIIFIYTSVKSLKENCLYIWVDIYDTTHCIYLPFHMSY